MLWAVKIGEPDYVEQIITTAAERITAAREWAIANDFDRFRVAEYYDNELPSLVMPCKKNIK